MLSCLMIVSDGWDLQLGDVRGALLETDALGRKKDRFPEWEFQGCLMDR